MSAMLWERRRSFRIPVSGKALLQHHGKLDGLYDVDDVSIDGCSLHKHEAAHVLEDEPPRRVSVSIRVEGASEIEMPARVVRRSSSGDVAQLGLRFTKASPVFEDFIQDLVMDSLENHKEDDGEVLVVHSHPERENALIQAMRGLGHHIVAARTPRDAVAVLERAAEHIRIAFVADVVGTSRARDIVKLILRRFPHVQCVRMSKGGAQRLLGTLRKATPMRGRSAWSLSRLRKVVAAAEEHAVG